MGRSVCFFDKSCCTKSLHSLDLPCQTLPVISVGQFLIFKNNNSCRKLFEPNDSDDLTENGKYPQSIANKQTPTLHKSEALHAPETCCI